MPIMPFVFMFSVYAIIKLYNTGKLIFVGNVKGELIERFNRYKRSLFIVLIISSAIIILRPIIEKRSRYADIEAPKFYDEGWKVVKVDDGLGDRVGKGLFAQLTSTRTILKKILYLNDDPANVGRAKIAYYTAWFPYKPEGGKLTFSVNGEKVFTGDTGYYGQYGYNEVSFDPRFLKRGKNVIYIMKDNDPSYIYILMDSDTYEECSWRSDDWGKTWSPCVRYGSKKLAELMIQLVIFRDGSKNSIFSLKTG
ncbi:unnamed protein product [marine sediment metagenome]|uniref:Uncharacterized protein n=1 Tax=marine sediment metagenome TaxID=412755 RepID=X1MSI9_9ZZZZ